MTGDDVLLAITEVSIAYAGFASIIVVFRRTGEGAWSPQERIGLFFLLSSAFAALFLSLLPFPLSYFGWSEPQVWKTSETILGLFLFVQLGTVVRHVLGGVRPRRPVFFWVATSTGFLVAACETLGGLGGLLTPGPALFILGLMWLLVSATMQFILSLVVPLGE